MVTIREIRIEDIKAILTNHGIRVGDMNDDPTKVLHAKQILIDNIHVGKIESPSDIMKIKFTGNLLFDSPYMEAIDKYLLSDASPEDKCKAIENQVYMVTGEIEKVPLESLQDHLDFMVYLKEGKFD